MSRIGRLPVSVPKGVTLTVTHGSIQVKGPKGSLTSPLFDGISCALDGAKAVCGGRGEAKRDKALHGTARALSRNAVKG